MLISELIGLDIGEARTGIARASNIARLAEPLMSVETSKLIETLQKFAKEQDLAAIAVGLPRNLKGDDTAQTAWVRDWVQKAKDQIKIPLYWQDEALTSKTAKLRKLSSKNPIDEHAMAAAIILQDFLDTPPAEWAPC